jgi:penicillin-binding protein 2
MKPLAELKNPLREQHTFNTRLAVASIGTALLLLVLIGRTFWLQVIQADHFRTLAEQNRLSVLPVQPARGMILDRKGVILAQNYSAYTLDVTPDEVPDLDALIRDLGALVEITDDHIKRFRRQLAERKKFESVTLKSSLTDEEVARLLVNRYRYPGIEVRARLFRHYPLGEKFAHVMGYIGRINDEDEQRLQSGGLAGNYRGADHIGKIGLEESYESALRGLNGMEKVETDARGRAVRVLERRPPVAGDHLVMYLDAGLQEAAWEAFGDYRGALVALDPATGGVLALVSKPGFDPNLFVDGIDVPNWTALNTSIDRPLVNRALRGLYPPGSTIKPFMALGALELGLRRPGDTIDDPGFFSLPGSRHRYRDWREGGHGTVNLKRSVIVSCDTYYYGLAADMGIDRMHAFLSRFGFGGLTGVDISGELSGLLPSREWKQRRFGKPWYLGETVICGIGQGYNLATPLQLAAATAILASDGTVRRPQLVQAIQDSVTLEKRTLLPQVVREEQFGAGNLALIKQAMLEVTQPGGTAAVAGANTGYAFAGKTGTAQVVGVKQHERYDEKRVRERHRDHALFIAFAPAYAPKIVVAVLVENGGHGGSTAAPIARKVIDYWLMGKRPEQQAAAPSVNGDQGETAEELQGD